MLSGGRDHLTHRVHSRLHDPRKVAAELAAVQASLAAIAVLAVLIGSVAIVIVAGCYAIAAAAIITALEMTYVAPTTPAALPPAPAERGGITATMPSSGGLIP